MPTLVSSLPLLSPPLLSFEGAHCEQLRALLCPDKIYSVGRGVTVAKPSQQALALTTQYSPPPLTVPPTTSLPLALQHHLSPSHPCQPVPGKAEHLNPRGLTGCHTLRPHFRDEEIRPRAGECLAWDTQHMGGRTRAPVQISCFSGQEQPHGSVGRPCVCDPNSPRFAVHLPVALDQGLSPSLSFLQDNCSQTWVTLPLRGTFGKV